MRVFYGGSGRFLYPVWIIAIESREIKAAGAILRKFADQDLTLVDAAGLHLMKGQRSHSCWSTDFHLGLTGVPLVTHEQ